MSNEPESVLRARIVAEALSWEGTPFHDCASVKGVGADCIGLLKGVFVGAGIIEDFELPPYKPQWFIHRDQPLFLAGLAERARRVEIPQPGDIAMFSFGRHAAHSAIIIDALTLIHAYKPLRMVSKGSFADALLLVPGTRGALHSIWSAF